MRPVLLVLLVLLVPVGEATVQVSVTDDDRHTQSFPSPIFSDTYSWSLPANVWNPPTAAKMSIAVDFDLGTLKAGETRTASLSWNYTTTGGISYLVREDFHASRNYLGTNTYTNKFYLNGTFIRDAYLLDDGSGTNVGVGNGDSVTFTGIPYQSTGALFYAENVTAMVPNLACVATWSWDTGSLDGCRLEEAGLTGLFAVDSAHVRDAFGLANDPSFGFSFGGGIVWVANATSPASVSTVAVYGNTPTSAGFEYQFLSETARAADLAANVSCGGFFTAVFDVFGVDIEGFLGFCPTISGLMKAVLTFPLDTIAFILNLVSPDLGSGFVFAGQLVDVVVGTYFLLADVLLNDPVKMIVIVAASVSGFAWMRAGTSAAGDGDPIQALAQTHATGFRVVGKGTFYYFMGIFILLKLVWELFRWAITSTIHAVRG